ncbi:MAG TPA: hypothetical protein VF816_17650 [Rhodocyclaceae bacterium]
MNLGSMRFRSGLAGAALIAVSLPAWRYDRTAFLAAWLIAWCFCAWIAVGGLVVVWIHDLTGGRWGSPARPVALAAAGTLPWLALLFLPLLAGLGDLYPWAAQADRGPARWAGELSAPSFKDAWLQPEFFALRAVAVLLLWNLLAWRARRRASPGTAAASLILWLISLGIAAADWIMSLAPLWYSSMFGFEAAAGQMLAGLAFAITAVCRRPGATHRTTRRDLGSLLFTAVLAWGYVAFCQYLIVWSENLPHEIGWYEQRRALPWPLLGWAVALLEFGLPFLLLLFRDIKDSAEHLSTVAVVVLGAQFLELCWLILPSLAGRFGMRDAWWLLPLCTFGIAGVCRAGMPPVASAARESGRG